MKQTRQTRQRQSIHSDDDLNEQINDKLSELWTGMKNKKRQLLRNLTPSYSRRSQRTLSQLNATNPQTSFINQSTQNQLLKIKQKLASEQSDRKVKENQIEKLKNTITQLSNDKKILLKQIHNLTNNPNSISICHLNQSSIDHVNINGNGCHVDGKTANFSTNKKKISQTFTKKEKSYPAIHESSNKQNRNYQNQEKRTQHQGNDGASLQDLSKARLIQLLKSTSEYRQFAYYYDSHQLSYLKRLQVQHKKNCTTNHSKIQQKYWAPSQLIYIMKKLNKTNKLNLNEGQILEIISEMKGYFEANEQLKIKQLRDYYQKKIEKLKRQKNNNLPYDLVRLSNAKERQISQISKKRTKSIRQ